jgi:Na+/H+-dicarboxylate symporter
MLSNNIFKAIADFCTNVLFAPYQAFRFTEGWWNANIVNVIFISIAFGLLLFWLSQLQKFRKTINE